MMITRRRRLVWAIATALALAAGATVSGLVLAAIGRPLSPLLGGFVYIALYGAVIGAVSGVVMLAVVPRGVGSWPRWIVASVVGFAVGYILVAIVGETLGNIVDPRMNLVVGEGAIEDSAGAVLGIAVASAQWRALGPTFARLRWWILATAVGAALGYGTAAAALELFEIGFLRANLVPAYTGIVGLVSGIGQAIALRRLQR